MSEIDKILLNALNVENQKTKSDFVALFKELYKIGFFKVGLDVVLTKAELGSIKFRVFPQGSGDVLKGCCITKESSFFHKIYQCFIRDYNHVVEIKYLDVHVIMHEIAHILEIESKICLNDEFERILRDDLCNLKKAHISLHNAIKKVMFHEIQLYPKKQHNSEYLARFYQLIAMSREIVVYDDDFHFKLEEILSLFPNTVDWICDVFNENLKVKVASHIDKMTQNIEFDRNLRGFSRRNKSVHRDKENKQWRNVVGSILNSNKY